MFVIILNLSNHYSYMKLEIYLSNIEENIVNFRICWFAIRINTLTVLQKLFEKYLNNATNSIYILK